MDMGSRDGGDGAGVDTTTPTCPASACETERATTSSELCPPEEQGEEGEEEGDDEGRGGVVGDGRERGGGGDDMASGGGQQGGSQGGVQDMNNDVHAAAVPLLQLGVHGGLHDDGQT